MADDAERNYFDRAPKPRRRVRKPAEIVPVQHVNGQDNDAEIVIPPAFTDDAIGLRFSGTFHPSLRHVAAWNRWMLWDGKVWRRDSTLRVYDLVRRVCRAMSAETDEPRVRSRLTAASTIAAIEKLVRSDRRHAVEADQWDANPWLLNTPAGIVNLETGETIPHDPAHHQTKITAVAPGGDCPLWRAFLDEVTGNDRQLADYLKRVAGYCLTGLTREHAMWFLYGTGRNGKGVFLNTIVRILGDYAMTASPDTFTADGAGKHLTVLARLQGARLVISQETEEGIPWAEARIKAVTGGDPITANHMRQDPFTYYPQFKLAVAGNHKPGLKSVDEAIRARFNLVPFTVTIAPDKRDPALSEKLWEEAGGILAWMIEGCWDWLNNPKRLNPPGIVTRATAGYFDSEDAIALWIKECCDVGSHCETTSGVLFKSWSAWAIAAGEKPGSNKAFTRTLERHGYPPGEHSRNGRVIDRIRLHVEPPRSEPERDRE